MNSMSMSMPMSMSMSMPMATGTASGAGSMATSMPGMDASMMSEMMGMMSSMTMSMAQMNMTFFAAANTPLYSTAWTPASTGQYAGTCIFLIALSVLLRLMYALKCMLEAHWARVALQRRYITTVAPHKDSVAASRPASSSASADDDAVATAKSPRATVGTLNINGAVEHVKVVDAASPLSGGAAQALAPFKLNTDLPRAIFVTVMIGVAYLLMLAVMTMNVGYFMSVLAGAFLGELLFGRWAAHAEVDHH